MQVIILAGGRGKRMNELTESKPKPLLPYKNKTLIEYKLENLPSKTSEILIVIGYMGDLIKNHLGDNFKNIPIKYIEQGELLGTADAVFKCREYIKNDFLTLMGDDIYHKDDLEKITENNNWEILIHQSPETAGNCIIEKNKLIGFHDLISYTDPIWTGAAYLDKKLFTKDPVAISNGEFGLPHTFIQFIDEFPVYVTETNKWRRITTPDDLI